MTVLRCDCCGVTYDNRACSDFCPHDEAVVQVRGPSIAANRPTTPADRAEAVLRGLLHDHGVPAGSFRTWIEDAVPLGPRGEADEDLPPRPALHIEAVQGPNLHAVTAAVDRLPFNLHGFDLHFHQ